DGDQFRGTGRGEPLAVGQHHSPDQGTDRGRAHEAQGTVRPCRQGVGTEHHEHRGPEHVRPGADGEDDQPDAHVAPPRRVTRSKPTPAAIATEVATRVAEWNGSATAAEPIRTATAAATAAGTVPVDLASSPTRASGAAMSSRADSGSSAPSTTAAVCARSQAVISHTPAPA